MVTTQFGRQAVLATAIMGAVLLPLAAGPAFAGHGYGTTQHPLRGDFPAARAATAVVEERAAPAVHESAVRGDWLRGDFPRAPSGTLAGTAGADVNPNVLAKAEPQVVGVLHVNTETTPATMRVFYLIPE